MAAPTLVDFFGNTAAIDTTNPANPKLVVSFVDFATVGFSDVAKTNDPEAWILAILKKIKAFNALQTDELSNVVVDSPFLGLTTRNNVSVREYSYTTRVYEPDTGSAEPDPDNV